MYNEDHSDDDDDDDEAAAPEVHLGFAVKPEGPMQLLRNHFPSKMGGTPAWLDPVRLPSTQQLQCLDSGLQLRFLLQVYSAVNDDPRAFHRSIYLFISPQGSGLGRPGAVRAYRCQLPRRTPFYSADPPNEFDPPRALAAADARSAVLRNPRWAARAQQDDLSAGSAGGGGGGGNGAGRSAIPCFPELALEVQPEPDEEEQQLGGDEHARRLMDEYKSAGAGGDAAAAERLMLAGGKGDSAVAGSAVEGDVRPASAAPKLEGGGSCLAGQASVGAGGVPFNQDMDPELDDFSNFTARIARAPAQCLRYVFDEDAKPLWASRARRPAEVPPCHLCGGPRRFEFQVMPQALHFMQVDSSDAEAPDWATIAVYTCAASCAPCAPHPSVESIPHTGDPAIIESYVGEMVVIHGLQAKPELNGARGLLVEWVAESERWVVESLKDGSCVRVRPANLRPIAREKGAPTTELREGGYAEEWVWLQTQE